MKPFTAVLALVALCATTLAAPAPATAGVDITPPAVASCHDLTYEEAFGWSDPDPEVPCDAAHTSMTVAVVNVADADWSSVEAIDRLVLPKCLRRMVDALGGRQKSVEMSAFKMFWFIPTRAQREAGASWVRCDLALIAPYELRPLPLHGFPLLGWRLPLTREYARCIREVRDRHLLTPCKLRHHYKAVHAIPVEEKVYPGTRKLVRMAIQKCSRRLQSDFYYKVPTRLEWKGGWRHLICHVRTRR